MSAIRLATKTVEKPWGRTDLPAMFGGPTTERVGEVWFEAPAGTPAVLLVKYIFTSEKLSVQVHPNDTQARAAGLPGGKSECWLILDAEPGAVLGLGVREPLSPQQLRQSALDGSIEELMVWKPVAKGDFFYVPAGTVHAIGPGLSLVEVQQNADVTYRLYDYGRPRELHLDEGIAVARARPYARPPLSTACAHDMDLLTAGEAPFLLSQRIGAPGPATVDVQGRGWFVPLSGSGTIDGQDWRAGECWLVDGPATLDLAETACWLIATMPDA